MQSGPRFSSNNYAENGFPPHGKTQVNAFGDVIRLNTHGPFNLEGVRAVNKARLAILEHAKIVRPYVFLNTWTGSMLMSPQCIREYIKGFSEAYTNRFPPPLAIAWVAPEGVDGAMFIGPILTPAFKNIGASFRIFDDLAAGEAWVSHFLKQTDTEA